MFFQSDIFNWIPFVIMGFIALVLVLIIIFMITALIKGGKQRSRNNHSPRLTVSAVVVSKRTKIDMHRHTENMHSAAHTSYFATFQFDSGDRMEFPINEQDFGYLVEGDRGMLTFQGTRYLRFERTYS